MSHSSGYVSSCKSALITSTESCHCLSVLMAPKWMCRPAEHIVYVFLQSEILTTYCYRFGLSKFECLIEGVSLNSSAVYKKFTIYANAPSNYYIPRVSEI